MVDRVLTIRRVAVVVILFLGFAYYRSSEKAALASIGLLSFAAIAQLVPAFFGGLFWQRANAQGALAGLAIGFLSWLYLLFIPTLAGAKASSITSFAMARLASASWRRRRSSVPICHRWFRAFASRWLST